MATELSRKNGTAGTPEERPRYESGWRSGKPAEDPDKVKSWGRIVARPSEFLIHMRKGKVLAGSSGQGASCFKWPSDAVAIVPTSIQRLQFTADQVTVEKVGVQVTGLAVYRIAEPLLTFKMLNFSYPERAQEKLEFLLREMFVGAARRLVANLTVEDCLTKRKEGIGMELMREIAPVVSGKGRGDERTAQGWGLVIDSIEIQDVRVLSPTMFASMQARYRQEQERKAREAEVARERAVLLNEAEAEREVSLSRLAAEAEVRRERQRNEEENRLAAVSLEARAAEAKVAADRALAVAKAQAEVERAELDARAEAARHAARLASATQEAEILAQELLAAEARRATVEAELAVAELEAKKTTAAQVPELQRLRELRVLENTVSPEAIQLALAQKLPELARAFQQNLGEIHITAVDGANPFGYIAAAIEGVMGLARSAGLKLPARSDEPPAPKAKE